MIRYLTAEESANLSPLKSGKRTWLYAAIAPLEVGQSLVFPITDWRGKTTPYLSIRNAAKKLGYTLEYGRHPNGKEYLIKRQK